MEVYFTVHDHFIDRMNSFLSSAKRSIHLMHCWITDTRIIDKLNQLSELGIDVNVLADETQSNILKHRLSSRCNLNFMGGKLFHHKTILIDGERVVTGSSNLHPDSVNGIDTEYLISVENPQLVEYHKQVFKSFINGDLSGIEPYKDAGGLVEEVWYSESGDILERILSFLDMCKKKLSIMHFWLTNKAICDKIIELKQRGVDVAILLDKRSYQRTESGFNSVLYLSENGVDVRIISLKLFHYKLILVDEEYVMSGSQNLYTDSFSEHYEDIVIYKDVNLANSFKEHFSWLLNNKSCYTMQEEELLLFCNQRGLKQESVCIVGSYILQMLGIREAGDIDFIVLHNKRESLGIPDGPTKYTKNIECVSKNWHPVVTDDEVIGNSIYHTLLPSGFKIIRLQLLIDKKNQTRRKKDVDDLSLIQEYQTDQGDE